MPRRPVAPPVDDPAVIEKELGLRIDGLVNAITGLGVTGLDKTTQTAFTFTPPLDQGTLEAIYRGNGIGRRIVDLMVHEMTRQWFEIEEDPSGGGALSYLEELRAKCRVQEALRWARLFGGSLVVLGLEDGGRYADEVFEEKIATVSYLHVFDRFQVTVAELYDKPEDPRFGAPRRYNVQPASGSSPFLVHESRTLRFIGAPIPPRAERELQGWGESVLQAPYEQLRNACASHAHAANLIEEWTIGALTITGLAKLLAAKDGEAKVRNRLSIIDYSKSVLRSMLLAEGETFERKTQTVAGLPELLDRQAQVLSAATGYPVSLLYGEPPSGLQATGAYNQANWYDEVKGQQEARLQPELEKLVRFVFLAKDGPTAGVEPEAWKIDFNSLWQMTPEEEETLRGKVAVRDVAYINAGVLEPEEVAVSRFGGERWSPETEIDPEMKRVRRTPPAPIGARAGNGNGNGTEADDGSEGDAGGSGDA